MEPAVIFEPNSQAREAAHPDGGCRSTRSYKNEQPWSFIIVTSEDADSYNNLLACLPEGNASWVRHGPVLMLSVARLNFESDGARNKHAFRDLAQAVSNIRKIFLGSLESFLHWVRFESLSEIMAMLEACGLSTIESNRAAIRNLLNCPVSGVDETELYDQS